MKKAKIAAAVLALVVSSTMSVSAVDEQNESFDLSKISIILNEDPVDSFVDSLDTDWYGGVYYENDIPHIISTNGNAENIQNALNKRRSSELSNIIIDVTSARAANTVYSIEELRAAKENVLDKMDELGVIGVGLNGQNNAISVFVEDLDDSTATMQNAIISCAGISNVLFRDASDLPVEPYDLPTDNNDNAIMPRYTVRGGTKIVCRETGGWSTLATSAVYDYGGDDETYGFLTCGHDWAVGYTALYGSSSGSVLGTVLYREESGNVDYSFIESNQNSNGYMTDGTQLTSRKRPSTGLSVKVYGARTYQLLGSYATGSITDTEISGEWDEIMFSDLFLTTAPTIDGDSGGAFVYNSSSIVGIMKGAKGKTTNSYGQYVNSVGVDIYNIAADNILPSC